MASLSPPEAISGLLPESLHVLAKLSERPWAMDVYLAGSAALAAYLGHRTVRDLDIMGFNRLTSPERRDLLQDLLGLDPGVRVETARDGFLYVRFPESAGRVGARFFYYPYPLIDPEEEVAGMATASAMDLALMKLGAVTSRARRQDFIDLYLLSRKIPLRQMLERSTEKFGHVRDFPLQALKGLAHVEPALGDPMPELIHDIQWDQGPRMALGRGSRPCPRMGWAQDLIDTDCG